MNKKILQLVFSLLIIILFGCKNETNLIVNTNPEGAKIFVNDEYKGQSPKKVSLSQTGAEIYIDLLKQDTIIIKNDLTEINLTAGYLPITANLPLYIAIENGYFDRNGLKINAIEVTSPNDILTGIVAGEVDFAAVLAYSILFPGAIQYPGKFKLYSSSEETSKRFTSSILVKKDSPINTYEDLRGKKIGIYTGTVQRVFLKAMLTGMGIDPSEVEIIEISPRLQIQGLISDQYDALSTTEPTTNIALIQGLAKVVVENPRVKYIMCPFPSTAATISSKLIDENPEAVKRIINSLNLAIDYINSNPEEAKKVLPKYTPIPKENTEEILADLKLFKYCKLGQENRLNVQRFADYLYETKLIKERIEDVNKLFGDYEKTCIK